MRVSSHWSSKKEYLEWCSRRNFEGLIGDLGFGRGKVKMKRRGFDYVREEGLG